MFQEYNQDYMALDNYADFVRNEIEQTALYQSFKSGDLLYGREDIRKKYQSFLEEKINYSHFTIIDQYNHRMIFGTNLLELEEKTYEGNVKAAHDYQQYFINSRFYQKLITQEANTVSTISTTPSKTEREETPKLLPTPPGVKAALKQKSKSKTSNNRMPENIQILYSCRAGIESPLSPTIHFCLDGINMKNVQEKIYTIKGNQAIDYRFTTSELRFIYKNWDDLKDKVKFYAKGEIVACPWEASPEEWKDNFLPTDQAKQKLEAHKPQQTLFSQAKKGLFFGDNDDKNTESFFGAFKKPPIEKKPELEIRKNLKSKQGPGEIDTERVRKKIKF